MYQWLIVSIKLTQKNVDVQIIGFGARYVQFGLGKPDQFGIGAEPVNEVRAVVIPGVGSVTD